MCLSPPNTHTNASSCPRQEYGHPSYRGDRDTISHSYHSPLHFHPISARTSFSLYNYIFRAFLDVCVSHAYTLSIFILVWGRIAFGPSVCTCTTVAMFFYALYKLLPCPP